MILVILLNILFFIINSIISGDTKIICLLTSLINHAYEANKGSNPIHLSKIYSDSGTKYNNNTSRSAIAILHAENIIKLKIKSNKIRRP